jgi:hypothetical protein
MHAARDRGDRRVAVDTVAKMMAVYGKVNITMAENAVLKLEQYRAKRPLEG